MQSSVLLLKIIKLARSLGTVLIYISPSKWTTNLMFESNTYNFLLLPVTLTIWWLNVPVVVLYCRYLIFCLTQTDMENPKSQGGRAETHAIFSFLTFHSILCEDLIPPAAVELRHTRHCYSFSGNLLGSPRSCTVYVMSTDCFLLTLR